MPAALAARWTASLDSYLGSRLHVVRECAAFAIERRKPQGDNPATGT